MFTRTVNFNYPKFEKCAFFKKSTAHFQKLTLTGTVNFDFRKFEKCAFLKKSSAHFQILRRLFSKVNVYRHLNFEKFKKCAAQFQTLMFTGTVNFDFRKFKKCAFF